MKTVYGQLVIGPPGSGKTTYCSGMQKFLQGLGRKVAVINIDPANDDLPYECAVDISELITVNDVMENLGLGPNGGLIYCMEFLEKNFDWLLNKLSALSDHYLLIDCPGQVELYTHHKSVSNIVKKFVSCDVRLCAVHLVDSHYCADPAKFISILLTSLTTMLQVELPYTHVLSKIDLIEKHSKLRFNLDFYTEVMDLGFLLDDFADDPFMKKFKKLNTVLSDIVERYNLVSFIPFNIQDKENAMLLMKDIDKNNGFLFGSTEERNAQSMLSAAVDADFFNFKMANIQEKYVDNSCSLDLTKDMDQTAVNLMK